MANKDKYFAALPSKEAVSEIYHKAQDWGSSALANEYVDKLRRSWSFYHGNFTSGSGDHGLSFTGEQNELVRFPVNHYRNIARHLLNMTTANRPSLKTRAINTDVRSQSQTILADGLLEYYFREKNLESYVSKATEYAIVFGEGYIRLGWNATAGQMFEQDENSGERFYEGDLEFTNVSPLDVIRDPSKEDTASHDWLIVRSYKNKFALAAKYPEIEDQILSAPSKDDLGELKSGSFNMEKTDDVPVYEFFHNKNDALPDGRYIVFVTPEAILYDGPLPYRETPIYRISPENILGSPFGYTVMFDLLPIQEAINMLYSTIITNQNAFGVQNVLVPKGADFTWTQLAGGLNLIEYNALNNAKPEALNLTQTPAEIFEMIKILEQQMETISGINSVTRGQPEASLRSASSLALIQAQAVQFSSLLQHSYVKAIENIGNGVIQTLQDYAKYPRVAAIVGKSQRAYLKEFSSKDLLQIGRVAVEVSNALAKTTAGRAEIANQLIQMGLVKNVDQYFTVLNTGRLDSMTEGDQAELLLVKSENEKMMDGTYARALSLDNHALHIQEHKALLADPDLRNDEQLVEVVLSHIQEHIELLRNTDPGVLAVTRQQALPPLQPPMPPQGAPGPQAPQGPTQEAMEGAEMIPEAMEAQTNFAAGQEIAAPQMPTPPAPFQNLPTNPANTDPQG
jgi:hypothetical protein